MYTLLSLFSPSNLGTKIMLTCDNWPKSKPEEKISMQMENMMVKQNNDLPDDVQSGGDVCYLLQSSRIHFCLILKSPYLKVSRFPRFLKFLRSLCTFSSFRYSSTSTSNISNSVCTTKSRNSFSDYYISRWRWFITDSSHGK